MRGDGLLRSFVTLNPAAPRWPIGVQAGLAISLPVAVFTLFGHPEFGLQAGMGAFTALYVAALPVAERMRVLPFVATALAVCGTAGVLASGSLWLTVVGLIVVSTVAILLAHGFSLGPPGPVFFPLIYGVSAQINAPVDGIRHVDGALYVLMLASGCAFAYLLVILPLVIPRVRRVPARTLREIKPRFRFDETSKVVVLRMASAATIGAGISLALGTHRGYWIVCSALAVLSVGHSRRLTAIRGSHRVFGTLVGAVVFLLIAQWAPHGLLLAAILGVMQFTIELLVVRNYALALAVITPLVLIITSEASAADPLASAGERVLDTVIGVALAGLVMLVFGRLGRKP